MIHSLQIKLTTTILFQSEAENTFVHSLRLENRITKDFTTDLWIGGYREAGEKPWVWKWTDGSPFEFTKWQPNQPDGRPANGLAIFMRPGNGKWKDTNDAQKRAYICEYKLR